MNKKSSIIFVVVVLLVVAIGALLFIVSARPHNIQSISSQSATSSTTVESASTTASSIPTQTEQDPWTVLEDYLAKAKAHDIAGVAALSYKLSATCTDPKQQDACFVKMDNIYKVGSTLKEADFVNRWEDSKQLMLSTNLEPSNTSVSFGYTKSIIIFVKDAQGNLKLLNINPNESWSVPITSASTTAEAMTKLDAMTKDTDEDGQTDQVEECIFPQNLYVTDCVKTDPNKRDSLGDGWWDGVRPYIEELNQ